MKRILIAFLTVTALSLATMHAGAANRKMTINELEQMISAEAGKGDSSLALQIYDVVLTEQMTAERLQKDQAGLPGQASRDALKAVADMSMFLAPPAGDILAGAAPDVAGQRAILQRMNGYIVQMIQHLPDFTAKRQIIHFHDYDSQENADPVKPQPYQAMHKVGVSNVSLSFNADHETIDRAATKDKTNDPDTISVNTESDDGAIIVTTLKDMIHGTIKWSSWQTLNGRKAAVFSYTVPEAQSHYKIDESTHDKKVIVEPPYDGIIAVDAETGTVLRLTVMVQMAPEQPLTMSDLLVDYAPVTLGGKQYYLPAKSIYYFSAHMQYWGEIDWQTTTMRHENWYKNGPVQTRVYDMTFSNYK